MKIDLKKETIELFLIEMLETIFSAYVGDKDGLKNIRELADIYSIGEEDWEDIELPWSQIKPYKNAYYDVIKQIRK